MINHPNRAPVYRVQNINGQFDHVAGKRAALERARQMAGAPEGTGQDDLAKHWGVRVERVSGSTARSVGL